MGNSLIVGFSDANAGAAPSYNMTADTSVNNATGITTGQLRWNDIISQAASSSLYVFSTDNDNNDNHQLNLEYPIVGAIFMVRVKDDSNIYQKWKIDSILDNTTYVTYGVTLIASNGGNIANSEDLIVGFDLAAGTASESEAGSIEIATQSETNTGTDDTRAITPLKLSNWTKPASDTAVGFVELATNAETFTGTDTTRAVTPAGLKSAYGPAFQLIGTGYIAGQKLTDASGALDPVGADSISIITGATTSDRIAAGQYSIAIGYDVKAVGTSSIAMGYGCSTTAQQALAIGELSIAAYRGVALGASANAGSNAISVGTLANATASYSMALGMSTDATAQGAIAVGGSLVTGAQATAIGAIAIGADDGVNAAAKAETANSIAIGSGAVANTDLNVVAIGKLAEAKQTHTTAVGGYAKATGFATTAIGSSVTASGTASTAVGAVATSSGQYTTVVGQGTLADSNGALAMGYAAQAKNSFAVVIGTEAQATGICSVVVGGGYSYVQASGVGSVVVGSGANSTYLSPLALGDRAIAIGGTDLVLSGALARVADAISIGSGTVAYGLRSIAFGSSSTSRVQATGSITYSSGLASNNDTITINGRVYTLKTTLSGAADEILLGANYGETRTNTISAINATAGAGTTYGTGTTVNLHVSASAGSDGVVNLTANVPYYGTLGNAITLAESATNTVVSGATLTGGVDGSAVATANDAMVFGSCALANGQGGIAIGSGSTLGAQAKGVGAIAIGGNDGTNAAASANAANVIAIGSGSNISGIRAVGIGIATTTSHADATAVGSYAECRGSIGANVAIGQSAIAGHTSYGYCTAIGVDAQATSQGTVALGYNARATGSYSMSLGNESDAVAESTIAIGSGAPGAQVLTGAYGGIAIGAGATALIVGAKVTAYGGIAIGCSDTVNNGASASGVYSIAIGTKTVTSLQSAIAIGFDASASGLGSIAIGGNDGVLSAATTNGSNAIAMGAGASATAQYTVAIGRATASANSAVAVGYLSSATQSSSSAYGADADATGSGSCAFGASTDATGSQATAIGSGAQATANGAIAIGTNADGYASEATAVNAIQIGAGINNVAHSVQFGSPLLAPGILGKATSVLTGTIDPVASTTVTGVGTRFRQELKVGDRITVSGETRLVTAIASETSLTVNTAFSDNANDLTPDKIPAIVSLVDSSGNLILWVQSDGAIMTNATSLPTSNPSNTGQLWNNAGVVTVS
jgi:hypothetical protein